MYHYLQHGKDNQNFFQIMSCFELDRLPNELIIKILYAFRHEELLLFGLVIRQKILTNKLDITCRDSNGSITITHSFDNRSTVVFHNRRFHDLIWYVYCKKKLKCGRSIFKEQVMKSMNFPHATDEINGATKKKQSIKWFCCINKIIVNNLFIALLQMKFMQKEMIENIIHH